MKKSRISGNVKKGKTKEKKAAPTRREERDLLRQKAAVKRQRLERESEKKAAALWNYRCSNKIPDTKREEDYLCKALV